MTDLYWETMFSPKTVGFFASPLLISSHSESLPSLPRHLMLAESVRESIFDTPIALEMYQDPSIQERHLRLFAICMTSGDSPA